MALGVRANEGEESGGKGVAPLAKCPMEKKARNQGRSDLGWGKRVKSRAAG